MSIAFGDGTTQTVGSGVLGTISHVYSTPGTYTATSDDLTAVITVTGNAPGSSSTTPAGSISSFTTSGTAPLAVTFYVSCTNAGTYDVSFGDGTDLGSSSAQAQCNGTLQTVTHTYTSNGSYQAQLELLVLQQNGTYSPQNAGSVSVTVGTGGGVSNPISTSTSFFAAPSSGELPLTVKFTGQVSGTNYTLNFGDGSAPVTAAMAVDCTQSVPNCAANAVIEINQSHVYSSAGTYAATVSASSMVLATSTVTVTPLTCSSGSHVDPIDGQQCIPDGGNPAAPSGSSAYLLLRRVSDGSQYFYDIGNNNILANYPLGQVGGEWQVIGTGDFSGKPGETDVLMERTSDDTLEFFTISGNSISASAPFSTIMPLNTQIVGVGDFSGNPNETDLMLRSSTGTFDIWDMKSFSSVVEHNNAGQVGEEWNILGFGDFSGNPNETDMLMRNSSTGSVVVYDITDNLISSLGQIGSIGTEWQYLGSGNFSGKGETDALFQNSNTGQLEYWDINDNAITSTGSLGQIGTEWLLMGFGNFSSKPGETDMLMRSSLTEALELYDITNNGVSYSGPLGNIGSEWQVEGVLQ